MKTDLWRFSEQEVLKAISVTHPEIHQFVEDGLGFEKAQNERLQILADRILTNEKLKNLFAETITLLSKPGESLKNADPSSKKVTILVHPKKTL